MKGNRKILLLILFIIFFNPLVFSSNKDKKEKHREHYLYIEYDRGMSSHTSANIQLITQTQYLTFYNVHLIDNSFFPDNSIIPNAFFKPLFKGNIVGAVKATTEPYYGIRIYYFLKSHPGIGVGIDFIHFKVFLPDESQKVHIIGTTDNKRIDEVEDIHDYFYSFNVSHGVNHIGFSILYRKMILKNRNFPDGKIQPFVSFHLAPCIPHHEVKLKNSELKAYSYQVRFPNFGFGVGLGTRFHLTEHFGLYIEYKYTYTLLRNLVFDNGEGKVKLNFGVHHLIWGFSFIL